ncbi:hydroxypyruvate isomerase [Aquitalea denitrificans]|uniref:hydroxypyruvate isomerase n=1 Tax=Aquitalea denitrificans TaxID=519081 RepID=UPI00135C50AF|nr:hydroxypyruvate isomerase [Aquitalea denitrificans]
MPRFAANLSMLFGEVDFLSRFQAAAKAGFSGVEYLFPYDYDKQKLAELLDKHHLVQVLHNLPAGNWAAGERGIACLPDRVGEFQDGVGEAIAYAKTLGCSQLNVLAGIRPARVEADVVQETLYNNLRFAAKALKAEGIKLLVEAINTFDIPGFVITRTPQVLALIRDIGSDNLFVQYDIYHMQRMEGELALTLQSQLQHIAHIQLADNPGRHEPGTGEINYPYLFGLLDRLGYQGWVGCEYKPKAGTVAGLGWVSQYL